MTNAESWPTILININWICTSSGSAAVLPFAIAFLPQFVWYGTSYYYDQSWPLADLRYHMDGDMIIEHVTRGSDTSAYCTRSWCKWPASIHVEVSCHVEYFSAQYLVERYTPILP
jgi:hypothetical protein